MHHHESKDLDRRTQYSCSAELYTKTKSFSNTTKGACGDNHILYAYLDNWLHLYLVGFIPSESYNSSCTL